MLAEWCLESPFCHGAGERVREHTYDIRDFDGVYPVRLMILRDD
ncbi:hypothetical protein [Halonotius pteroides]